MNKDKRNKYFLLIKKKTRNILFEKHNIKKEEYTRAVLNTLVFNVKTRITAVFKDHLIFDDSSEFLRR
jgi:hypothetical protein